MVDSIINTEIAKCQFTKEQPRGKNVKTKHWAILLYVNGLSFRVIAKLV